MNRLLSFILLFIASATQAAVELDDGQVWWGFYTEDLTTTSIGEDKPYNYNCAMRIDGSDPIVGGCTITAIRFPLVYRTSNIRSAKVWIGSELPADGGKADIAEVSILDARLQGIVDGGVPFNEVKLKEPVVIPEGGLYVGFSLKVRAADRNEEKRPIVTAFASGDNDHACFYYSTADQSWQNLSADYMLALQVAVSGDNIPANAAVGGSFIDIISEPSALADISIPVRAMGAKPVSSIDCQLMVNGEPYGEQRHCDFETPIANFSAQHLSFSVEAPAQAGNADCSLRINRVNGEANERPEPVHSGTVAVLSAQGRRATVMEEFTGAWCAWCPRGTAAMQMLSDLYPDRFVGIAIHRGDPMQIAGYDAFKPNYDSYPGAFINRNEDVVDPYNGLPGMPITDIVSYTLSQPCEADLAVNATWSEPAIVDIDVTTTFRFSTTQRNYALALVVLQDGLTGSGDDWAQKNNYSGNAEWKDQPYMQTFYELPGLITDYAYDHVAISTSGIERGITGSITSPIVSDEPQHFVTTVDLSDNPLLQDQQCVHIAAMLIYRPTGIVVNAARAHVTGEEDNAVSSISHNPHPNAFYSLDGRRHDIPVRGLNIITSSDGSVKKKIIR